MDLITALAVSIGLLGAVATYLYLTIGLQIWIGFIGWASFFHCGGGTEGFKKSLVSNLWGMLCGWIALALIQKASLGLPGVLWASIAVGLLAGILVLGAKIPAIDAIPAAVYGFASVAGYTLLASKDAMDFSLQGPLLTTALSLAIGAGFGVASEKFAGMLQKGD